jgi:hypothetical protein
MGGDDGCGKRGGLGNTFAMMAETGKPELEPELEMYYCM